ncbi:unnamed protein product [Amoebophrya sp. A25]|nr:unnamed protein product [Amoebophrya sp. A25]|eukprot:GSA25T00004472001.1
MSLVCSLTGRIPFEPVVLRPSGYLFEKSVLEERLEANGNTCPISGASVESILPVKTDGALSLRTVTAANLPGVLSAMQQTFDDMLTASFNNKRDLDKAKEQLLHALHQHDAATRTIKRILAERDMARATVKTLEVSLQHQRKVLGAAAPEKAAEVPEAIGFSDEWRARVAEYDQAFAKKRKEGAYKEQHKQLTPVMVNKEMQQIYHFSDRHQASAPGINCCALDPADNNNVLTGGVDGHLEVINVQVMANNYLQGVQRPAESVRLAAHEGPISCCGFHPAKSSVLLSGCEDGVVKIWNKDALGRHTEAYASPEGLHDGGVRDMNVHPINELLITAGARSISYVDMNTGDLLRWINEFPGNHGEISQFKLHPNGKAGIAAVGRSIQLWDIAGGSHTRCLTLDGEEEKVHDADITALAVSHNAINVVSGCRNGVVRLWDLRKQDQSVWEEDFSRGSQGGINKLRFDPVGHYLAVAHSNEMLDVVHFESKATLAEVCSFPRAHRGGMVMDAVFADRAQFLVSVGLDRSINFYQSEGLKDYFEEPDTKRLRSEEI